MPTIKTTYTGNLRTRAIHIQSGTELLTDAPTDNRGKGEYFSPTDLLATSLGCCILTTIGISAETNNIVIDQAEVETTKVMYDNPRRVGELLLDFSFPGRKYTDREKAIIENTAKTCPVTRSLNPQILLKFHFHYENS